MSRPWRGNIRELENAVEIAVIRSQGRTELTAQDFPPWQSLTPFVPPAVPAPSAMPRETAIDSTLDFNSLVAKYERELIFGTLETTQENRQSGSVS